MDVLAFVSHIYGLLRSSPNHIPHFRLGRRACRSMTANSSCKLSIVNTYSPTCSPCGVAQNTILPHARFFFAEQADIQSSDAMQSLRPDKDGSNPSAFRVHKRVQRSRAEKWNASSLTLPLSAMVTLLLAKLKSSAVFEPQLSDEAREHAKLGVSIEQFERMGDPVELGGQIVGIIGMRQIRGQIVVLHEDEILGGAHAHGAIVASRFVQVVTDDDEMPEVAQLLHPAIQAGVRGSILTNNNLLNGWICHKGLCNTLDVVLMVEALDDSADGGSFMGFIHVWLSAAAVELCAQAVDDGVVGDILKQSMREAARHGALVDVVGGERSAGKRACRERRGGEGERRGGVA